MPKLDVYDVQKKKVGEIDLDDAVFGAEVKAHLLHEVVRAQLAGRRSGTAAVKERAAVRASSKKLYRQKGTGRARHGSRAAPLMRGAGRTKGPVPRDLGYRPPRKVRLAAMRSALSLFREEGRLVVLDSFPLPDPPKTRVVAEVLARFEAVRGVICDGKGNEPLRRASRNLPKAVFLPPEGLNVYDLLKADRLLVTRVGVDALSRALKPAKTTRSARTAKAAAPKKA